MAESFDVKEKSIDNALQRIKRKIGAGTFLSKNCNKIFTELGLTFGVD
ncbi:hypothetical protein MAQA_00045 [Listeria aquatica FSL S10-1188]|uniref:Uncharacterized protein n=1 Tax=Listeria aquatica FSL S10-1188 TaxID=1265818 RepID=W7BNY5_9LIST|nr:hypothetical protein MAQA_00045 [Listeria aquatica FSL S10-1188]